MGAQIKLPPGTGPYCYRIHGQIYHMVSHLYSNHNKPGYGQLYIFDTSKATEKRIERNEGCLPSVMDRLDSMLRAINPFIDCYLQMHRIIEENTATKIRMVFMENLNVTHGSQPTRKGVRPDKGCRGRENQPQHSKDNRAQPPETAFVEP
ncbi:hypothetical protein AVEN_190658-1 [Araneus ventricosus]|uniref:Helitron helicase-like domain-containing protein n=1 Tax=Araneus ventricosus TaxID=182803 RepID=A0A4Y2NUM2_ARAVE|nr:hypothetical protein AVEN_190658-1 [Araneus ventricosus]